MDLTPNIAPAIADAMAQLKQMIPEDLKQAHDALADLEDKLMAAEGQFAGELAADPVGGRAGAGHGRGGHQQPDESAGRFFYEVIARREYPLLNHRRGAVRGC